MNDPLAAATDRAEALARDMIVEYVAWRDKITYGAELHGMYMDTLAFLNFRIETADTCLLLVRNGRIADALGLCRSLLEYHLLFMLMCRGTKLFKLEDLSSLSEAEFRLRLAEKRTEPEALQAAGQTPCLGVNKYPRAKRHLMYIFEGYHSPDPDLPGFMIPAHYFHFHQFRPEAMRLKDENYFQFTEPSTQTKQAVRGHQNNEIPLR